MKVLSAAEMREVDRLTTERHGVPSLELMENAGRRVVEFLQERFPGPVNDPGGGLRSRKIVILCGKGNNGGDGLVVARLVHQAGVRPEVLLFAAPESVKGDAAVNLKRWRETRGSLEGVTTEAEWASRRDVLSGADIILDALLGTGLSGPVHGLLADVIADVNRARRGGATIVAVDIPSGLASDSGASPGESVRADFTVTFTAPKVGLVLPPNCERVGGLLVRSIGSPAELLDDNPKLKLHWLEPGEFRNLPLRRQASAHKGDYGHALIVAGSRGKTGAAVLAAWGALRVGAGLVTVATPRNAQPIVASLLPEMMTEALDGTESDTIAASNLDYGRLATLMKGRSVLAMGPGITTHAETQQFVRAVLAECSLPIILDADGLNTFAGQAEGLKKRAAPFLAITPHPGEMARLRGSSTKEVQSHRLETARESAAQWNVYVILKGYRTIVAAPDGRAYINSTGNPGMASGGTGDVLMGILTGLTAQFGTESWEKILSLGVYLHGRAGDLAVRSVGEIPMMASDLVHCLPEALQKTLVEIEHA